MKIASCAILIGIAGYILGILTATNNANNRIPIVYVPPKGVYANEFKKLSAHYAGWCYAIGSASISGGRLIPAANVLFNKNSVYRRYEELGYKQGQKLSEEIRVNGTSEDILYFKQIQKLLSENIPDLDPKDISVADFD